MASPHAARRSSRPWGPAIPSAIEGIPLITGDGDFESLIHQITRSTSKQVFVAALSRGLSLGVQPAPPALDSQLREPGAVRARASHRRSDGSIGNQSTGVAQAQTAPDAFVIVDDCFDMGPFASRFVRTSPLNGPDREAARAIVALFDAPP